MAFDMVHKSLRQIKKQLTVFWHQIPSIFILPSAQNSNKLQIILTAIFLLAHEISESKNTEQSYRNLLKGRGHTNDKREYQNCFPKHFSSKKLQRISLKFGAKWGSMVRILILSSDSQYVTSKIFLGRVI